MWMRRADGACFPSENTVTPLQDVQGRQVALSLVRDLSRESVSTRFASVYESLTRREQEVFAYTARGLSAKEIARELALSHRTVEQHRNSILKKFGIRSVRQLLAEVATLGVIAQARAGEPGP
jgi:DNA-binding CsgD family transcriptional regulator